MASVIHIIRHGITEGIQKKYFYGWVDLPVVEEGFDELEMFKKADIYPKFDYSDALFYTSGLTRANQTLETIFGDVEYEANPKLKEINFGDWELKTYHDLESTNKWQEWMEDTTGDFRFPNGDSAKSFFERIIEGYNEVLKNHKMKELSHRHDGKDAVSVIVCHGGTIASIMLDQFPGQKQYLMDWTPHTGCGYSIYYENGEAVKYELITYGDLQYQI